MRAVTLFCILLAGPVSGQTIDFTIDLSALGWGELDTPEAIETDGDSSTREWLIRPLNQTHPDPQFRVVAIRGAAICASAWFSVTPTPSTNLFLHTAVERVGTVDKLLVRQGASQRVDFINLNTPQCPAP